jgi:hypothetical protein
MRHFRYLAVLAAGFLALSIGAESLAQIEPLSRRAEIVLFDGPNFTGTNVTIRAGEDGSNLVNRRFNDRASSMRVLGTWEVCEHIRFEGTCRRFNGDVRNLGAFNDQISSVRVVSGNTGPSRPTIPALPNETPRSGVHLYDNPNFNGQRHDVPVDNSNLQRTGFNDRAGSLVVAPGETWQVCVDSNYRSLCRQFSDSVADLNAFGLNNNISSLRRVGGPVTPGRPTVPPSNGFTNLTGETEGVNGVGFFSIPRANGTVVDHCERSLSGTCGDTGADAVCRMAGYREATFYNILPASQFGGTVHIGDGTACRGRNCGAIVNLLCVSN